MDSRPGWHEYFIDIAERVAQRADCTRRQASAVIVKDHRIVSTGYNGAPAGDPGCLSAGACPRGRLTQDDLASYSSYDTGPGFCIAVHAEANALLHADRSQTEDATLYTWSSTENCEPCAGCWRLIRGAGIEVVVYPNPARTGLFFVTHHQPADSSDGFTPTLRHVQELWTVDGASWMENRVTDPSATL